MTFSSLQSDAPFLNPVLTSNANSSGWMPGSSRSILFVDRSVNNYQSLLESQPGVEIKILDSSQDALTQITETLAGRHGIESIQILSHGASGELYLGQDFFTAATLAKSAQQIQSWQQALTEDADILLYGCNVGSGSIGQAFLQSLSQLTGADVAASDDLTGVGGDWVLESTTGTIEAKIALNAIGMANYQASLNAPLWAQGTGGSANNNDSGNAIAVDGAGNTYITGKLQGSNIPFGGSSISTKDGSPDAFVTKLDASGNFLWAKTFAGSGGIPSLILDSGQGITVDGEGNAYVIGLFQGTMNLGSFSLSSNGVSDVFVLKLNGNDGSVIWGENFGGDGVEQGFAIGLDSSNNAYITGTFGDGSKSLTAKFGGVTLTQNGTSDAFIAKLNGSNGDVAWAKNFGGSGSDIGFGIASAAGGVYVAGKTGSSGNNNIFAVKLDSNNGNTIWNKNFGGIGEDTATGIAVDGSGNAYLTGYFDSPTASFDNFSVQNAAPGLTDVFAAKLNSSDGSVAWAEGFGGYGTEYGNGIGVDGNGNVYLAGSFSSTTWNLGTTVLVKTGTISSDVFTLKISGRDGSLTWAKKLGGNSAESAYGIAVDSAGNSYLTGDFYSTSFPIGSTNLSPKGGYDFFVTKLDNVDPIDREATGTLSITGTAQEGGSLTANLTNVVDADGATTTGYRWQVLNGTTWTNISGQTNALLNIASDQSRVGQQVRVIATTTDTLGGTTEFIGTAQTIANVDDAATGTLAVTGTAIVGGSLSASLTAVTDLDGATTVAYRWQELVGSTWTDISGQTSATFSILNNAANVGKQVRVIATTTDPFNGRTNFTSTAQTIAPATTIDREATGTLGVTGTAQEGSSLTASLTNVVDADGATTTGYRWQVLNGSTWTNISGQTNALLNIASDQSMVGQQVRVIATTTDVLGGTTEFTGTAQTILNVDDAAIGTLAISGTAQQGNTINAVLANLVDPDGTPSISYQWQELSGTTWNNITGASAASLALTNVSFVGKTVRVIATTTDPLGGTTNFTSTQTVITAATVIDQEATGTLSVTGTAQEGGSLTASLTNVVDADGATTTGYRWQVLNGSTWTNIAGQTNALLNIASDQSMVGQQVRVIATTTDTLGGTTEFIGTAQTIANVDDAATGTLAISGTAQQGNTLSAVIANLVDLDGTPSISYQWQELSGTTWNNITGASAASLALTNVSFVGKTVRVVATTTDPLGGISNFTSAQTTITASPVTDREATGTLGVTGTAQEGSSLTASLTNVVDADGATTIGYRWQVLNGSTWTNIAGQTASTLNIASDQSMVGQQVRVIATTTDVLGGTTEFIGTAQTILNVDDAATGTLAISGTAQQGNTINAVLANLVDPDGTPSISYQWQELSGTTWNNITGASAASLALTNVSFVGKTVRVVATTTDPLGGISNFTSAQTTITASPVTDREATGNLAVTGTAQEGGSLTASLTNVVDADGATTTGYRWQVLNGSTWTNISGQTNALLNIASDQSMVGQQVRVIATTTDVLGGTTEFIGTAQTILNVDDAATGTLAISGTAQQGNTINAVLANLVDPDGTPSISYQWQELSGTTWNNITGASAASLALTNVSFVGKTVRVIATTTDPLGGTTNFTSIQTVITAATVIDQEATGTLSVTGTAQEGSSLTATLSNVVDGDGATTTAYRWQVLNGSTWTNLSGQTTATLPIASDQSMVGQQVRVIAITTDVLGGTTEFIGNSQLIANVDDEATGMLSVTGNGTIGGSLTASLTNVVDEDGTIVRTYRWQEFTGGAWSDIAGATSALLSIANNASLVGQQRRVIITTTDVLGGTTSFTSDAYTIGSATVTDQESTGTLGVTGTAQEGSSLTVSLTNVVDADGATTTGYRWQVLNGSTWTNIAGQTASTLNIASDQSMVGQQVRVIATTTDTLGGTTEFIGTAQTILNVDDAATGTLAISGTAQQGNTINAVLANLVDPDGTPTITYQWQELSGSTWSNISGAIAASLALTNVSFVGKTVRVVATTTDPLGGISNLTSAQTTITASPVTDREATGNLAVTGTAQEGSSLTASLTNVVDADGATTIGYRWQVLNGSTWTNIAGQTASTLNIASDQSRVGQQVRVIATTTDTLGGTTEFIGTAQTILNVDDAATGTLAISGTAQQGNTLSAVIANLVDLDGAPIVTYRWQELSGTTWSDITGATSENLVLNNATFVGKTVRVIATTTDPLGGTSNFTSAQTTITAATTGDREATGTLSVTGFAVEGGVLTASLTNVVDVDGATTTTYRWQVLNGGTWGNLSGQTNAAFNIASDQSMVGKQIRVIVTTTDGLGGTTEFIGNSQLIANVDDEATGTLSVTGNGAIGGSLTANLTNVLDEDGTIVRTYRWQEFTGGAWSDIAGATSALLSIANNASLVGQQRRVIITTTDVLGGTTSFTSDAYTIGLAPTPSKVPDYNGDGKADLLWRNSMTGQNVIWYLNGNKFSGNSAPSAIATDTNYNRREGIDYDFLAPIPDQTWQIVGQADFNNDGKTDVLWRNSVSGINVIWYLDGKNFVGTGKNVLSSDLVRGRDYEIILRVADVSWKIEGVGDFNGDGKTDILWRNSRGGENVIWYLNGDNFAENSVAHSQGTDYDFLQTISDQNWKIEAVGDFNGDQKDDIVWRNNQSGLNVIWYANFLTSDASKIRVEGVNYDFLRPVNDRNWHIELATDVNGDGKTDLVWRNYFTGQNVVWYLDGKQVIQSPSSPNPIQGEGYDFFLTVPDSTWRLGDLDVV